MDRIGQRWTKLILLKKRPGPAVTPLPTIHERQTPVVVQNSGFLIHNGHVTPTDRPDIVGGIAPASVITDRLSRPRFDNRPVVKG